MSLFSRTSNDPNSVELSDFAEAVNAGACVVIDVREPHEYATGHVPGALSMPLSSFDPDNLPPPDKPVILICQAGGRSRAAMGKAHTAGRLDVKHYAGGASGWRSAGGDIEV